MLDWAVLVAFSEHSSCPLLGRNHSPEQGQVGHSEQTCHCSVRRETSGLRASVARLPFHSSGAMSANSLANVPIKQVDLNKNIWVAPNRNNGWL